MGNRDFYQILGVGRDATMGAIKAAYRRKAKTLHPDQGGDPEEFRALKLAYEVLSDALARRHYDHTGEAPAEALDSGAQARLQGLAMDLLMTILAQTGAPQFTDVVDLMRRQAEQQTHLLEGQAAALEALAEKMNVAADLIRTDDPKNLLKTLALRRRGELVDKAAEVRGQIETYRSLLELLEGYGYEVFVDSIG